MILQSYNYKGGTITESRLGRFGGYRAMRHGVTLYEGQSEPHAKAALTRYHKKWLAERAADHARALAEIRGKA